MKTEKIDKMVSLTNEQHAQLLKIQIQLMAKKEEKVTIRETFDFLMQLFQEGKKQEAE